MKQQGPMLETLTRRLEECPPDFLVEPGKPGFPDAGAVASDLIESLGGAPLMAESGVINQMVNNSDKTSRNLARLRLVACWLLADPWFRGRRDLAEGARDFLLTGLKPLAALIDAGKFIADQDRREELVRTALEALGLRPAGESEAQAEDRLATLSSVERKRIVKDTRKALKHARQVMAAMRQKAVQAAAAKVSRE